MKGLSGRFAYCMPPGSSLLSLLIRTFYFERGEIIVETDASVRQPWFCCGKRTDETRGSQMFLIEFMVGHVEELSEVNASSSKGIR
jgi:hypothetical protein